MRQQKDKRLAHKPKKADRLGVDPFDGNPEEIQRFIQDVEIKLNYFRESVVDDMDKISVVIPLLRAGAPNWYHSIHVHIKEDVAICNKRPFDTNNVLQTWEGIPNRLVSSLGGHWDQRSHSSRM